MGGGAWHRRCCFHARRSWFQQEALARAKSPHARDRASFIAELPALLEGSGRLVVVVRDAASCSALGDGYRFWHSDGHTRASCLPRSPRRRGPCSLPPTSSPARRGCMCQLPWATIAIPSGPLAKKSTCCATCTPAVATVLYPRPGPRHGQGSARRQRQVHRRGSALAAVVDLLMGRVARKRLRLRPHGCSQGSRRLTLGRVIYETAGTAKNLVTGPKPTCARTAHLHAASNT